MSTTIKIAKAGMALIVAAALALLLPPVARADNDAGFTSAELGGEMSLSGYDVRVLLNSSATSSSCSVTVRQGSYSVVDAGDRGQVLLSVTDSVELSYSGGAYYAAANGSTVSSSQPLLLLADDGDSLFTYNGKSYRGSLKLMYSGSYYYVINVLDIDLYLYGVVGRELGYNYDDQALMAQAVAARSYALANVDPANKYYDVTATTTSQVYGGYSAEADNVRAAVDATVGMVVTYNGKVVMTYFCSNAGGHTEDVDVIWSSDKVPMKGVESPYDSYAGNYSTYGASTYSWSVTFSAAQLETIAQKVKGSSIGNFQSIQLTPSYNGKTSSSGRAMAVTIIGSKGSATMIKNDSICSNLGLKSSLITLAGGAASSSVYVRGEGGALKEYSKTTDLYAIGQDLLTMLAGGSQAKSFYVRSSNGLTEINKDGSATGSTSASGSSITINGRGYGHGVGMSQWGAIAMADNGYSWQEIIEHYYCNNGLELTQLY